MSINRVIISGNLTREEKWRWVPGFEGLYMVSSMGNVMSVGGRRGSVPMKLLVTSNCHGYRRVCLRNNGRSYQVDVHRLVAISFISNPFNKTQVNHKDGNKSNNHVSNLEWVTVSENVKHSYDNLPRKTFSHFHSVKLTKHEVVDIFTSDEPTRVLMDRYGVSDTMIYKIKKGKCWKDVTCLLTK